MSYQFNSPEKQSGAVLVISLIMLLALTLTGVSGMQVTSLEEKMAGNMRDQNIAFQAAESALLQAESFILTNSTEASVYAGANGLLNIANAEPTDYFLASNWVAANSSIATNNYGLPEAPRFIIKKFAQNGADIFFRVTARAIGKTPGTQIILQSVYIRTN